MNFLFVGKQSPEDKSDNDNETSDQDEDDDDRQGESIVINFRVFQLC